MVGKPTDVDVAEFMMSNLGTVDAAVIFDVPDPRCSDHVAQVQAKCTAAPCGGGGGNAMDAAAGSMGLPPGVDLGSVSPQAICRLLV